MKLPEIFKDNKLVKTITIIVAVATGIAAVVTPAILLIRHLREKAAAVAEKVEDHKDSVSDEAPDAEDAPEAADAAQPEDPDGPKAA